MFLLSTGCGYRMGGVGNGIAKEFGGAGGGYGGGGVSG